MSLLHLSGQGLVTKKCLPLTGAMRHQCRVVEVVSILGAGNGSRAKLNHTEIHLHLKYAEKRNPQRLSAITADRLGSQANTGNPPAKRVPLFSLGCSKAAPIFCSTLMLARAGQGAVRRAAGVHLLFSA